MNRQNTSKMPQQPTGRNQAPVPEFFMPAMPPIELTEALDRWIKRWMQRRKFRRLLKYDDHNLAVLGLKREDLQWAARQPVKKDAFEALAQRLGRCA